MQECKGNGRQSMGPTGEANMQRQAGKGKLSGIVKQVGCQAWRQADSGNQHIRRGRQVVQRQW
jgi:hypothetical protein